MAAGKSNVVLLTECAQWMYTTQERRCCELAGWQVQERVLCCAISHQPTHPTENRVRLDTIARGLLQAARQQGQRTRLVEPRVHAPVRDQADEVQRVLRQRALHVLPAIAGEYRAVFERNVDERRALLDDLPRAERVVANLGVAHVIVRGQPDRGAVRLHLPADLAAHLSECRVRAHTAA